MRRYQNYEINIDLKKKCIFRGLSNYNLMGIFQSSNTHIWHLEDLEMTHIDLRREKSEILFPVKKRFSQFTLALGRYTSRPFSLYFSYYLITNYRYLYPTNLALHIKQCTLDDKPLTTSPASYRSLHFLLFFTSPTPSRVPSYPSRPPALDSSSPHFDMFKILSSRSTLSSSFSRIVLSTPLPIRQFSAPRKLRVSIIGPPNAGKSTLFNRFLRGGSGVSRVRSENRSRRRRGRKAGQAIVSEVAGTTRDRRECIGGIGAVEFKLYDTAGVDEDVMSMSDGVSADGLLRLKAPNPNKSEDSVREEIVLR